MTAVRPWYQPASFQDSAAEGRLILRDGSTATVRLSRTDDRAALADFYRRLSPASRRLRFFSDAKPGADVVESLLDSSDPQRIMTLVVLRHAEGAPRIVATGSYIAGEQRTAEFAVAVEDSFHGKGIGGLLLERLSVLAAAHGFVHFVAVTHSSNKQMLDVFHHSGFKLEETHEDGYVRVDLSVMPREESVARSEMRDRLFTKASIRPIFHPRSVAVVGASRDPASFGHRILEALVMNRFQGPVYPVNPNAQVICSIKAFPRVSAIPDEVDLAVIAVPRDSVMEVVDDCAQRGVRALIVISAGFAETGAEGARRQQALVEKVRGYGMRLVGPNCLGLLNTDPEVQLNASFSPTYPPAGRIALSSQSGALGLAILSLARQRNLGLSTFISMGNKADVTGNDLLQYWEDDPRTDVILLYLESFGNPRRFSRIARRVSRSKPIVCVKSGRFRKGLPATHGLTANPAGRDAAVDALFRQAGVIRADTLEEMFDVAALLGNQPLPKGRRVCIVTNSHGCGVLAMDRCEEEGLSAAGLSHATIEALTPHLPEGSNLGALVDLSGSASPELYRLTIERALLDPQVDSLIAIYIPLGLADMSAMVQAFGQGVAAARAQGAQDKPVLTVMMTGDHATGRMEGQNEGIPRYLFPETAARALGAATAYSTWRSGPSGVILDFEDTDSEAARTLCRAALAARGGGWLTEDETRGVLRAYGLTLVDRTTAPPSGSLPLSLSVAEDSLFGPLLALGPAVPAGTSARDVSFRITPLTDRDAREMMAAVPALQPLVTVEAAGQPADLNPLQEMLLRVSQLVEEVPEIVELELDPLYLHSGGLACTLLGAGLRVETPSSGSPLR